MLKCKKKRTKLIELQSRSRQGVIGIGVGESLELGLIDGLEKGGFDGRQEWFVRGECALKVGHVHRMTLKKS